MEDALAPKVLTQVTNIARSLNPCCNGRCTRTTYTNNDGIRLRCVLILVVMEDALARVDMRLLDEVVGS